GVLCPHLAALAVTGYPSTFEFVARKEKIHCACNIFPGIVGQLEMAHALGCVAPRPLLLMQGQNDHMFPVDLFRHTARQVEQTYRMTRAPQDCLCVHIEPNAFHSWTPAEERIMVNFLREPLRLNAISERFCSPTDLQVETDIVFQRWPDAAINTAELARRLTGIQARDDISLPDVFPPALDLDSDDEREERRVILAQFEAFLKPRERNFRF
ncbi:MAG: hypothetical protein V1899_08250, partial [Planctomycetota bacterium]